MKTHIFTEGSNTTAEDLDRPAKDYYGGLFGIVSDLHKKLAEPTDSQLHVLSGEYGVVSGEERISSICVGEQKPIGRDEIAKQARDKLLDTAGDADVMIILLSTRLFQQTVEEVWNELVATAKPESIWCIGAARSAIGGLDFEELETKGCTVFTYQRVGVARIDNETREELLETVKQKAAQ